MILLKFLQILSSKTKSHVLYSEAFSIEISLRWCRRHRRRLYYHRHVVEVAPVPCVTPPPTHRCCRSVTMFRAKCQCAVKRHCIIAHHIRSQRRRPWNHLVHSLLAKLNYVNLVTATVANFADAGDNKQQTATSATHVHSQTNTRMVSLTRIVRPSWSESVRSQPRTDVHDTAHCGSQRRVRDHRHGLLRRSGRAGWQATVCTASVWTGSLTVSTTEASRSSTAKLSFPSNQFNIVPMDANSQSKTKFN